MDSSHAGHTQPRPTHITTRSLTLAPGKERHTRRYGETLISVPLGSGFVDSNHAGHNLTLRDYSHLQPLANQLPAACLRHTKVPTPLAWNLDGGSTKKKYPVLGTRYFFCQWKRKKGVASRVESSWYWRWKSGISQFYNLCDPCNICDNNKRILPCRQLYLLSVLSISLFCCKNAQ